MRTSDTIRRKPALLPDFRYNATISVIFTKTIINLPEATYGSFVFGRLDQTVYQQME